MILSDIEQHILNSYDVNTVLLYGSHARGDFTEASDIDLALFGKNYHDNETPRNEIYNGYRLDLWFYPISDLTKPSKSFLKLSNSRILFDKTGLADGFLKSLSKIIKNGPDKLKPDEVIHQYYWLKSMINRSEGDSLDALYRRHLISIELFELYFSLNEMWFLGSKNSESWLKINDSKTYILLKMAMKVNSKKSDIILAFDKIFHPILKKIDFKQDL